jgi:hypothetical protein
LLQATSLALLSTVTVVGSALAGATVAGADVSSASGYAFGASITVANEALLAPTPLAKLGQSATLSSGINVPGLLSIALPTVKSAQSPAILPSPKGSVTSSVNTAEIQVAPSLLGLTAPLIDIDAIKLSCVSNAEGSSAVLSTLTISVEGGAPQTIPAPPPNTIPQLPALPPIPGLGSAAPVLELNRQVVTNVPAKDGKLGHTSITADGVYLSVGSVATVIIGAVNCGVSGPDVEAPPSIHGLVPDKGPVKGGTKVTITGDGFLNAKSVYFENNAATDVHVVSATEITAVSPAHPVGPVYVTVTNGFGTSPTGPASVFTYTKSGGPPPPPNKHNEGYWLVASDGGIFTFGHAKFYGSAGSIHLNKPIVGMTAAPHGTGYWLVATDGGIFTYGSAHFYGSTGSIHLNQPIVGMAATPDGKGYWLVASDGGIFSFGDAKFYGSTGSIHLNKPIVGMASSSDGKGYWLVATDGGIFTFGDAKYLGSTGSIHLNKPIEGMSVRPAGLGYWLVASDGGIFTFGNAPFLGSAGDIQLHRPMVGMASTPDGNGYWEDATDGGVFTYGDAKFLGSTGDIHLNKPMVGMAPSFTTS